MKPIAERGYAHPEALVSTDWVAARLQDPTVRIVESEEDLLLYETEVLVRCAEETGAWVVGPVYYIGELERKIIHMAGGTVHFGEENGKRILYEEQYHLNTPLAKVGLPLKRKPVGHLEFHCLLVRADVFEKVGMLDEGLLSVHETSTFVCQFAKQAGRCIWNPVR